MLKKQVDSQQMKIIRLSCKLQAIREAQAGTGSPWPIAKEEIFGKLVSEMQELAQVPKRGRRFSELMLDISQLLFSLSPRSYRVLRQIFVLPTVSTLYCHFGTQLQKTRTQLTSLDSIDDAIKAIKDEEAGENENIFTLGVDAFAFRSFCGQTMPQLGKSTTDSSTPTNPDEPKVSEQPDAKPLSNGFMFLLIPLSPNRKCKLLNITARPTGNYDETIDVVVSRIKSAMSREGLKLFFKATDGDRYLSQEHASFFTEHICQMPPGSTFAQVTDSIYRLLHSSSVTMPIADLSILLRMPDHDYSSTR